jgi:hypothetical protein
MTLPFVEEFIWSVPAAGFRRVTTGTISSRERQRWLTDAQPVSLLRRDERNYHPLKEYTGLFLIFGELEAAEADVLTFANRFGSLLGDTGEQVILRENDAGEDLSALAWGERLDLWQSEVSAMKSAIGVWKAICDNDSPALEKFLESSPLFGGMSRVSTSGAGGRSAHSQRSWRALNYVQAEVNARLENHVALQLGLDTEVAEARLFLVPKNLLGALWLQFSLAVEGRKQFRECAQCAEPFEVSVDMSGKRSDARFCRQVCRVNHYRARVAEAARLHAKRLPYLEIAKRLNTNVPTVRNWVSKGGQDGEKARSK